MVVIIRLCKYESAVLFANDLVNALILALTVLADVVRGSINLGWSIRCLKAVFH